MTTGLRTAKEVSSSSRMRSKTSAQVTQLVKAVTRPPVLAAGTKPSEFHQMRTNDPDDNNQTVYAPVLAIANVKLQQITRSNVPLHLPDRQFSACGICKEALFEAPSEANPSPDQAVMPYPCRHLYHNQCIGEHIVGARRQLFSGLGMAPSTTLRR